MSTEFVIREAEIDDVPAIAQVSYITWPHTYRGIIPDEKIDSRTMDSITDTWSQIVSLSHLKGGTLVAVNDESIIAYSRFYPRLDTDDDQNKVATAGSIYVLPGFQRQGWVANLHTEFLRLLKLNSLWKRLSMF